MSAAIVILPAPARVLNQARAEIGGFAQRYHTSEAQRRRAVRQMIQLLTDGASLAWALHAARNTLRPMQAPMPPDGGRAA